jgi:DNA repair photolyase
MRTRRIVVHEKRGTALTKQRMSDPYEFPFTLNPYIGCLFACNYCFLQQRPFSRHAEFGTEVKVKTWLPEKLNRGLARLRGLPQYLKRVQVGVTCENFLPEVLHRTRLHLGRDIMREILEVFERHWNEGNRWMVHVLTKSHLVTRYVDILSRMKHMVQVEVTMICLDEGKRRQLEPYAPSVQRRLQAIQQLADAGVFVRIMAMPLMCDKEEALELKRLSFEHGAKAFKHKGLNYFDREDVLNGVPIRVRRRNDTTDADLLVESGEPANGETVTLDMPVSEDKRRWIRVEPRIMPVLRSGYTGLNEVDWGYLI